MVHFNDLELRIGKIVGVKDHPNADKLYVLLVDIGIEKELQLVAGLKNHYSKDELIGKKVVVFVNLKPVVLRGVESVGMVLAAVDKEKVALLSAKKSNPRDRVFIDEITKPAKEIGFEEWKQLKITAQEGKVVFNGKKLRTEKEEVFVDKKISDGAVIQ